MNTGGPGDNVTIRFEVGPELARSVLTKLLTFIVVNTDPQPRTLVPPLPHRLAPASRLRHRVRRGHRRHSSRRSRPRGLAGALPNLLRRKRDTLLSRLSSLAHPQSPETSFLHFCLSSLAGSALAWCIYDLPLLSRTIAILSYNRYFTAAITCKVTLRNFDT